MIRKHHFVVQVLIALLTIGCTLYALGGTGISAIISAIFVVALRVEANTGGVLMTHDEASR